MQHYETENTLRRQLEKLHNLKNSQNFVKVRIHTENDSRL